MPSHQPLETPTPRAAQGRDLRSVGSTPGRPGPQGRWGAVAAERETDAVGANPANTATLGNAAEIWEH